MLTRTRHPMQCNSADCAAAVVRTVWDGDSDPYGLCPENAEEGSVCIDLFISKPKEMGFKGDNRSFDPNASPDQSRVQVVASADGDITLEHVSPSCGPVHCAGPYAEGLASNNISSVKHDDGSFTVNITAYNSASFSLAPAIDASVTFHPDGNGGFTTSGRRDQMPSMGIYQRSGGQWNELRRSPEKGGLYLYWFAKDEVW